jgi:hypothetical protein
VVAGTASAKPISLMDASQSSLGAVMVLIGESLREVAVLIAVFVPLDFILQQRPLTTTFIIVMIGGVLPLFAVGIFLEVRGRWIR